jgi:hypothetical protein
MKKAILAITLLLIPSLATASGFVFASPKKEPYIKPGVQKVSRTGAAKKACDPSYPTVCLHPGPPDLSCRDIGFANFPVVGSDPHGLDRDRNGIGCETRQRR